LADQLEESAPIGDSMASIGGGGGVVSGGYHLSGRTIFVQGVTGVTDDQRITIKAKKDGTYQYVSVQGATRTIEKYIFFQTMPN